MPSKLTRKNVSAAITRRMTETRTDGSFNRNKENVTEVPAVRTKNARQEHLIKPLQEKKSNHARKEEKAEASKPVRIVETKAEKSSTTRRHATERKILKNVSSARIEQSTMKDAKSQTANLTSPKNKSRVTRKNTALENSRTKRSKILISKKIATRSKLDNQMPAKRGDSPKSIPQHIFSNVKSIDRMAASSEPKKKIPSKQAVELDEATTSILKKMKPVVSLVKIRRMEESEHKTTFELPIASKISQTQSKRKPVISSQKRRSKSVDYYVDSKFKTVDPNRREVADPDIQLHVKTTSKIQEAAANPSMQPVYKKKLSDNEIATTSVFNFTTNSHDFSTDSDEPLKDVIQKMVRENKAIVKHKEKKGVTKAKDRVMQTKSKLQNSLSKLIEINHFTMESLSKDNEIGEIEVADCELPHIWYKPPTPSRVLPITYRANKKALPKSTQQPSHQSTPVRQMRTNIASPSRSPWHVADSSSSIDFDFSKINNHDESKDDLKENEGNSISSDRTNNKNQRQPLNTKQTSDELKMTEKVISYNIENYFGFTVVDESDNDGNITETTPIRKRLPPTRESLPGNIHGAVNELATQPIISNDQKNPINSNTDSSNQCFKRLTALHNYFTSKKFQKPCSSTDPIPDDENDGPALFDSNWHEQENNKHHSYTRVPKRTYDYERILNDDESEAGDMPTQRRIKKTKTKVDHGFEDKGCVSRKPVATPRTSVQESAPTINECVCNFRSSKKQNHPIDVIQLSERLDIIEKSFEVVNTEISDLRKELQEVKLENSQLKKKLETRNVPAVTETVIIPLDGRGIYQQLPLNSIDELKTFKENLKVRETFIYLENRLGAIGGTDSKECLTRIFNKVMSKDLQKQISLTGRLSQKPSLMKYATIMDLMHGAVRLNYDNYNDITGEKIIGAILRG